MIRHARQAAVTSTLAYYQLKEKNFRKSLDTAQLTCHDSLRGACSRNAQFLGVVYMLAFNIDYENVFWPVFSRVSLVPYLLSI